MICFRDKRFCPYWQACTNSETCDRAITPEVIADAVKWWGAEDFPIAMFSEKPRCFEFAAVFAAASAGGKP
jgi:hypothetical protein